MTTSELRPPQILRPLPDSTKTVLSVSGSLRNKTSSQLRPVYNSARLNSEVPQHLFVTILFSTPHVIRFQSNCKVANSKKYSLSKKKELIKNILQFLHTLFALMNYHVNLAMNIPTLEECFLKT